MQNFGEHLREDLKKHLNEICFHLMGDNVVMCELNGIGSISADYNDVFEKLQKFVKSLDYVNVIDFDEYRLSNRFLFYSDEYKTAIESSDSWQRTWGEIGCQIAYNYFIQKNGFKPSSDYHYSLDTSGRPYVFTCFVTRGSELGGNRRVEAEEHTRRLNELEILEKEIYNKNQAIIQSINAAISEQYTNHIITYNSKLISNDLQNNGSPKFTSNLTAGDVNVYLVISPSEKNIEWNEFNTALQLELEKTISLASVRLREIRPLAVSFE